MIDIQATCRKDLMMNRISMVALSTAAAASGFAGIGLLGYAGQRYWRTSRRPRERVETGIEIGAPYNVRHMDGYPFSPYPPVNDVGEAQAAGETGISPLAPAEAAPTPLPRRANRPADPPEEVTPGDVLSELSPATRASTQAVDDSAITSMPEMPVPTVGDFPSIRPPTTGFAAKGRPPIPKPRTILNQGSPPSSMPRAGGSAQSGRVTHHDSLTDEILGQDIIEIAF